MTMTPAEIRKATLGELLAAREKMMSTRWMLKLKTATKEEQEEAARTLVQVHHAVLELQNQKLADIRDKLVANEKDLADGIAALKKSLRTIETIGVAVKAIGQFLQIVARVVKLLAMA
jgi:hypothetical protein